MTPPSAEAIEWAKDAYRRLNDPSANTLSWNDLTKACGILHAALFDAAVQRTPEVRCTGCGSRWTDADLCRERAANPEIIACCPEREPLTIDQWAERAEKAEAALASSEKRATEAEARAERWKAKSCADLGYLDAALQRAHEAEAKHQQAAAQASAYYDALLQTENEYYNEYAECCSVHAQLASSETARRELEKALERVQSEFPPAGRRAGMKESQWLALIAVDNALSSPSTSGKNT